MTRGQPLRRGDNQVVWVTVKNLGFALEYQLELGPSSLSLSPGN